jgi:hypothetical protein
MPGSYYCSLRKGKFNVEDAIPFKFAIKQDKMELEEFKSTCGLIKSL